MINQNENEDKNEKIDHADTAKTNLGLEMNTNIVNINVSLHDDAYK